MLFHLSIAADDPEGVAGFLAEIWGGEALPFPAVIDGSWAALAGDDRGTMIEVYPRGTEIHVCEGEADAIGLLTGWSRHSATHMAIATSLDAFAVLDLCQRRGWDAKYCRRGGRFGVLEIFVEGCQMIEVLTPEMQREYLDTVTIPNWHRMLEAGAPLATNMTRKAA